MLSDPFYSTKSSFYILYWGWPHLILPVVENVNIIIFSFFPIAFSTQILSCILGLKNMWSVLYVWGHTMFSSLISRDIVCIKMNVAIDFPFSIQIIFNWIFLRYFAGKHCLLENLECVCFGKNEDCLLRTYH